jgi:hypothetical protein
MCSGSGPLPGTNRKVDRQLGAKLSSIFSHSENLIIHLEVSNYMFSSGTPSESKKILVCYARSHQCMDKLFKRKIMHAIQVEVNYEKLYMTLHTTLKKSLLATNDSLEAGVQSIIWQVT